MWKHTKVYKIVGLLIISLFFIVGNTYAIERYIEPAMKVQESDVIWVVKVIGRTGDNYEFWNLEVYDELKNIVPKKKVQITAKVDVDFTNDEYSIVGLEEGRDGLFYSKWSIPIRNIYKGDREKTLNSQNLESDEWTKIDEEKMLKVLQQMDEEEKEKKATYLFVQLDEGSGVTKIVNRCTAQGLMREGKTYVAVEDMKHIFLGVYEWDFTSKTIKIAENGKNRVVTPVIRDGKAYLPVREMVEILGKKLIYEKQGKQHVFYIKG